MRFPGLPAAGAPLAHAVRPDLLHLADPPMHGAQVAAMQRALLAQGIHPGPVDGRFGALTEAALIALQLRSGLVMDGILGPETAAALGLSWPIRPGPADEMSAALAPRPRVHATPAPAQAEAASLIGFRFEQQGRRVFALASTGERFLIGSEVAYTDDMPRRGLAQLGAEVAEMDAAGVYDPAAWEGRLGPWAWFLWPILLAESAGRFGRLNSYDRAGFTFGCAQFAAHTPGENLVLLFRRLLDLPGADLYFPELSLREDASGRRVMHLRHGDGGLGSLEAPRKVTRPNGRQEMQLADLMAYLNANPKAVDEAERLAAARLILWCIRDPQGAQAAQLDLAREATARRLKAAFAKAPALAVCRDWRAHLWVADILHQGRGSFAQIRSALAAPDPVAALSAIGARAHAQRIRTVGEGIERLAREGRLEGWLPPS